MIYILYDKCEICGGYIGNRAYSLYACSNDTTYFVIHDISHIRACLLCIYDWRSSPEFRLASLLSDASCDDTLISKVAIEWIENRKLIIDGH